MMFTIILQDIIVQREAIKHCLELKQKLGTDVIEFDGVKYADLHECCRMLKFPYRRVVAKNYEQ